MRNISIVIPVYNEAERIAACLESIAAQTVTPLEVIVVDNNSTDATVSIARSFPFVRVITAKCQGVIHARNRGFNAARGEIIGRIDADTRLPADWVQQVQNIFAESRVAAISGSVRYHDVRCARLFAAIDLRLRRHAARNMGNEVFLQGANMAVRKSAWRAVRHRLCSRGGMHEDFDLAIHLAEAGHMVEFREDLTASISARCLDDTVSDFWSYALLSPGTYAQHNIRSGRYMYPIVILILLFHLPLRTLYRNSNIAQFTEYRRVNPATFVD
jgi:glycosyltransferase involved in cell wall biosynthesis